MRLSSSFRVSSSILSTCILLDCTASVYSKGGGHASGHGSSSHGTSKDSQSSKSGTSGSNSGSTIIWVNSGGTTKCYNQDNQLVPCPINSHRQAIIIGAVVGSICGIVLIALTVHCFIQHRRKIRDQAERKSTAPPLSSRAPTQGGYRRLDDAKDDSAA